MTEELPTVAETDLDHLAEAWLRVDPDDETRDALAELRIKDPAAVDALFRNRLSFGTAGLRGSLAPGPGAMNRVLVRVVAAAIGAVLLDGADGSTPRVVIGYDARHKSRDFAEDTARVLAAMQVDVVLLDRELPTPVLAFGVLHLNASAGVMVTASHNPRTDNGYKVYWGDGAQISSPIDTEIAARIDATPLLDERALADLDDARISRLGDELVDAYLATISGLVTPGGNRDAKLAYTPLHGVGATTFRAACRAVGFADPAVVAEQAEPDPEFPTTPFPNPEEAGVLDPLLELATNTGAAVALANDPDADRLSIASPVSSTWRLLSGDELGCLLAEHLLRRRAGGGEGALLINTIVSSRLLEQIAAHHGATSTQTLTGFKWIMAARDANADADFVLGYEEALGYCVGEAVRDKDGISAALVVAEMVGELAAEGRTVLDLLDDLHRRHGVHVTGQRSIKFEAVSGHDAAAPLAELRLFPPEKIGGEIVREFIDLDRDDGPLPSTNAVVISVDHGRIIVRPSGTEPKIKIYGETWTEPGTDLASARDEATVRLEALVGDVVGILADFERQLARLSAADDDHEVPGRAATLFAELPSGAKRVERLRLAMRCIDLTTLSGDDTPGRVRALCAQARRPAPADPTVGPTAAVCVYPALVHVAADLLRGTGVHVASVATAFPSGLSALSVRLDDIRAAIADGANEVDVVLNRSAFLSGDIERAADELREMRTVAAGVHLKVIIEIDELGSPGAIRAATRLAIDAGADWVKTSTGKTGVGATPDAALVMAETIAEHAGNGGRPIGLKLSGGIRTADQALGYLSIVDGVLGADWLTPDRVRFGASGLASAVVADLARSEYALRDASR